VQELYVGTVLAGLIFLSSVLSVELGISASIIEIALGVLAGNFLGVTALPWVTYIAGLGGILLTFLAGAEVDLDVMRAKFKESLLIGGVSFLAPFLGAMLICHYLLGWEWKAAQIAGVALSTTSLAVVYAVLVETGLTHTSVGKLIMAATFVTDFGTAAALALVLLEFNVNTLWFALISGAIILLVPRVAPRLFARYGDRVIEPEIKFLFLLLLILMYFAKLGMSHAILPAFVLGLVMSRIFQKNAALQRKLRVVGFAFITPIFFLNGGMKISLSLLWSGALLFVILLAVKQITKIVGVYPLAKRYIPNEAMYTTLLMSTGLTMGTLSSVAGLEAGFIDQLQFSVLVAVVVASAIVPTFIAQRFFHPHHVLRELQQPKKGAAALVEETVSEE
jgi:Kef-type K+ transport system membrane component KefB